CRIDYSKDQDPIVSVENQLTKLRSQFSIASKEILPNYCVFMNNKADSMLLLSDRICFSSNIDTVSQVALLQGKEAGLRRELRKFFHPASQPTKILPAKMISSNQWDIDLSNIISLPGPVTFTFTKREQEAGVFFGMNLAASKGFLAVVDCKDSDPKIIPVECARYIDIVSDDNCTTFVGLRVDGLVDAFRITDEKPEMILESLGDSCSAVAISNDAKTLAFGNALGVLSRIDLSSPKLVINDTNLHRGRISCINIANGIGILSGDDSGELVFQDSKNEVQWRERIGAAVSDLRIDPTGNLAAVGFVQGTSDFSDFQRRAVEKHDLIVVELANGMPLPVKPINSFSVESNVGVPWFLRRHFSAIRGISWAENGFGLSWNFDERSPENGAFWRDGFAADTMWGDTSRDFSNELSSKFGINWNPAKGVYRDWTLSNVKGDEGWRNLTKVCRCIREQRVIDADLKAAVDYAISKMESGLLVELDDYLFKEKLLPECVLVRKALAEANTKDIKMQIRLVQVSNRFDPEVSLQRLGVLLDSIKDSKNIQVRADALAAKLQLVIALNQLDKFDESLSIKQEFYRSPFLAGYRQDDEVMPDIQARFGLTHLALGDFEAHRNMCTEMNARLAKKCLLDHPIRFLVQTAVCKPDAIDNWSSVADIAESFYSDQAAERDPRSFYIVGAANLRAGRFDKAFESLASCREAMGNWKAEKGKAHPFEVSLLLGILAHKKGDLALAKMELERSEKEFESAEAEAISKGSKYFLSWEQRLNFKLLRQELQDSLATN
ncbi:MAG: tetratricopeptide repeat protein, partial [Planctomycetaceae bacterium]|nr:tetratricopeptide repeat protein [Planctomycetaceae bacterium]